VLNREPPLKPYADLPRMASLVQGMVRDAMDAFVSGDISLAEKVLSVDDEVDELYSRIHRDLVSAMRQDGDKVERGIQVQSVAKWLERMGDHATNIAEQVIFLINGKDIRHLGAGRDGVK
jgi:phosphate transport system protein